MHRIIKWWKCKHFDLRKACIDKYTINYKWENDYNKSR